MSVTNSFKDTENNNGCKESENVNENSLNNNNVVEKFENYRSKVEQIQTEYKEAKLVIDRLKEEISQFQEMEKRNLHEILSLKSQLKILEEKRKSFFSISEKQCSIEKTLNKHDESIIEIQNVIQKVRENFQNKISTASRELELIQENRHFKSALQCTEESLELFKNEMENALKEKEELIQQHLSRNNQLNGELEKLKSERDVVTDFCNETVDTYKKQIHEYETIIKKMEEERTRILADYEVSVIPQTNYESTGKQDPEVLKSPSRATERFFHEREDIFAAEDICLKTCENFTSQTEITRSNFSETADIQIKRNSSGEYLMKSTKYGSKQKPKIEFLDSCEPQMKRRLYSDNDYNYLN